MRGSLYKNMNKIWYEFEKSLGYDKTRILAHAVSWIFRDNPQAFLAWYDRLPQDYKTAVQDNLVKTLSDEILYLVSNDVTYDDVADYFKLPPIKTHYSKI